MGFFTVTKCYDYPANNRKAFQAQKGVSSTKKTGVLEVQGALGGDKNLHTCTKYQHEPEGEKNR